MKQRDKGIVTSIEEAREVMLRKQAESTRLPAVYMEPIAERAKPKRLEVKAIGYLDGEALQYETYKAQRSDERPGMPATFEDFLTISRMGQDCERGWFSGAIRGLAKG